MDNLFVIQMIISSIFNESQKVRDRLTGLELARQNITG